MGIQNSSTKYRLFCVIAILEYFKGIFFPGEKPQKLLFIIETAAISLTFAVLKATQNMFTIVQITAAHSKVKSGADFPDYVQELIKMDISAYDTYVKDGHTEYAGRYNYQIESVVKYTPPDIAANIETRKFISYLEATSKGKPIIQLFATILQKQVWKNGQLIWQK